MMKEIKQNEKGFTLVELVVVIAILAVLAALMVPRIIGSVEDARRSSAVGDARTLASEIATWNAQQAAETGGGSPVPPNTYDSDSEAITLTNGANTFNIAADDWPDKEFVSIEVLDDGDVQVNIVEP